MRSKSKWKRRLIFLACIAFAVAIVAWWFWPRRPKVSFVEFRGSGTERVAVFALENDTGTHFSYESDAETREMILGFRIRQDNEWKTLDPHTIMPTPDGWPPTLIAPLKSAERIEFPVRLIAPDKTPVTRPFRIGVFIQSGNPWNTMKTAQSLSRWLPARAVQAYEEAHNSTVWSETVTP